MKDRVTYQIQYFKEKSNCWCNVVGFMWTESADNDIDNHLRRMRETNTNVKYRVLKITETYEVIDK